MADLLEIDALLARVPEDGCPFCGRDPYEYVDIGVGFERVAVSCCEAGIGLLQYGDESLRDEVALRTDLVTALRALRAEVERQSATISDLTRERDAAREALAPFAAIAPVFDDREPPTPCRDGDTVAAWGSMSVGMVEVTVGDFRRARAALSPTTKGGADA